MAESASEISIVILEPSSETLTDVKALWRSHSKTLGFFPEGAFAEFAANERILVANVLGAFAGYLAFRIAGDRGVIVHLCTTSAARGSGVARALVNQLLHLSKDRGLRGVGLSCRADFEANTFWPKLGFNPVHEKEGRSKEGKLLTYWWFDHRLPDLFSAPQSNDGVPRVLAAIDANVFYDLISEREQGEQSRALLADWLQAEFELCITDEIYHEIMRGENEEERRRNRERLSICRVLTADNGAVAKARQKVESLLGQGVTDDDKSDRAHLAKAIAAGVRVFVTRDEELIEHASELYDLLGLEVLRPVELVAQIDQLRHAARYEPAKLASTRLEIRRIRADEIEQLPENFCRSHLGEKLRDFRQALRDAVVATEHKNVWVLVDGLDYQGVYILVSRSDVEWSVPVLRFAQGPLRQTVTRHYALRLIQKAVDAGVKCIRVEDTFIADDTRSTLLEQAFFPLEGRLVRCVAQGLGTLSQALGSISQIRGASAVESEAIRDAIERTSMDRMRLATEIERMFWPLKVIGENIPTFAVPIHPHWAQHLVDYTLADQELFGAEPALALNREHVYYRSARMCGLQSPARILWYVTKDIGFAGSMAIRACSRLVEIEIGAPKELHKKYQRLGVYSWQNVFDTAGRSLTNQVMALRFVDTEPFKTAVEWRELKALGIKSTFQSPVRVDEDQFREIYLRGTGSAALT